MTENERLLEMARTDYYRLDNGQVIEAPTYPTSAKVLTLGELRKLDPDTILTAKFYSAKRGGVARHKIKVGRIVLPEPIKRFTRELADMELTTPLRDAGFNVKLVGSIATKGVSAKDIDILLNLPKEPRTNLRRYSLLLRRN